MKRGDEALNTSSFQFFSGVKRFIATIFVSALNTPSSLLFIGKNLLTLHRSYFLKEIHRLPLHCRYFLK
jgi:hypothetical protein